MNEIIFRLFLFLVGYIIGSISFGYLIARWRGITDIRLHGSGATGATNVARILGKRYFFIIFALDFLRAFFTLFFASHFYHYNPLYLCMLGIGLIVGNGWPIFLGFRGGKGVATALGVLAVLAPQLMIVGLLIWFIVWYAAKNVGIASVVLFVFLICASFYIRSYELWLRVAGILGIVLHQRNISDYIRYLEEKRK